MLWTGHISRTNTGGQRGGGGGGSDVCIGWYVIYLCLDHTPRLTACAMQACPLVDPTLAF